MIWSTCLPSFFFTNERILWWTFKPKMTMTILLTPKINLIKNENSKSFCNGSKMNNVIGHSIFFYFNADSLEDAPILRIKGSCVLTGVHTLFIRRISISKYTLLVIRVSTSNYILLVKLPFTNPFAYLYEKLF